MSAHSGACEEVLRGASLRLCEAGQGEGDDLEGVEQSCRADFVCLSTLG